VVIGSDHFPFAGGKARRSIGSRAMSLAQPNADRLSGNLFYRIAAPATASNLSPVGAASTTGPTGRPTSIELGSSECTAFACNKASRRRLTVIKRLCDLGSIRSLWRFTGRSDLACLHNLHKMKNKSTDAPELEVILA